MAYNLNEMRRSTYALAALTGLAAAGVSLPKLTTLGVVLAAALAAVMILIAVTDWQHFIVPDVLSLPAIPIGLLATGSLVHPDAAGVVDPWHVLAALLGGAMFWAVRIGYQRLRGRPGLGLGDVKLAAAGGAWVGLDGLPLVVLTAALGSLAAALVMAWRSGSTLAGDLRMPFGAFLAPAIWLVWFLLIAPQQA